MTELDNQPFSIGGVFRLTFGAMNESPVPIFGVSLLMGTIVRILTLALQTPADLHGDSPAIAIPSIVARCLALTCIVHATVEHGAGRKAGLGDCLSLAARRLLPLMGVFVLYVIAVLLSALVLLIPGIMVMIFWCLAMPAIVEERAGVFGAFGRSQDLTRGARLQLFGLLLILLLISLGIFAVLRFLSIPALGSTYFDSSVATKPVAILFSGFSYAIQSALWGTCMAAAYVLLRNWKEGSPEDRLNEIFA